MLGVTILQGYLILPGCMGSLVLRCDEYFGRDFIGRWLRRLKRRCRWGRLMRSLGLRGRKRGSLAACFLTMPFPRSWSLLESSSFKSSLNPQRKPLVRVSHATLSWFARMWKSMWRQKLSPTMKREDGYWLLPYLVTDGQKL